MKSVILCVGVFAVLAAAVDYCDKDLCKAYQRDGTWKYTKQVGCGNDGVRITYFISTNNQILIKTCNSRDSAMNVHLKLWLYQ